MSGALVSRTWRRRRCPAPRTTAARGGRAARSGRARRVSRARQPPAAHRVRRGPRVRPAWPAGATPSPLVSTASGTAIAGDDLCHLIDGRRADTSRPRRYRLSRREQRKLQRVTARMWLLAPDRRLCAADDWERRRGSRRTDRPVVRSCSRRMRALGVAGSAAAELAVAGDWSIVVVAGAYQPSFVGKDDGLYPVP